MSNLKQYIDTHFTPAEQEKFRLDLGWTQYRWTWHVNHPAKWTEERVRAWSHVTNISYETWVSEFGLGKEKIKAAA